MPAYEVLSYLDVFTPDKTPKETYVPRLGGAIDGDVRDTLTERNTFVLLAGPSKIGKTALLQTVLNDFPHVFVSGGDCTDIESFWGNLAHNLELRVKLPDRSQETTLIGWDYFVSAKREVQTTTEEQRFQRLSRLVLDLLAKNKIHIIIENFHYVPEAVQRRLLEILKEEVPRGFCVILTSVQHRLADIERLQPDLKARAVEILVPAWSAAELKEIGRKGFDALALKVEDAILDRLAAEALGSPLIMHHLCRRLCVEVGREETGATAKRVSAVDCDDLCRRTARKLPGGTADVVRHAVLGGPGPAPARRPTTTGGEMTGYEGVVHALEMLDAPRLSIPVHTLKTHTDRLFEQSIPPAQLKKICERLVERTNSTADHSVLAWDKTRSTLSFVEPFTLFKLRWGEKTADM